MSGMAICPVLTDNSSQVGVSFLGDRGFPLLCIDFKHTLASHEFGLKNLATCKTSQTHLLMADEALAYQWKL